MGVLEYLVIATIVIAGAWVGYNAWEESTTGADPHKPVEPHGAPSIQPAVVYGNDTPLNLPPRVS